MILVTGATGQLGTAVIQNLLKKTPANQIAVLLQKLIKDKRAVSMVVLQKVSTNAVARICVPRMTHGIILQNQTRSHCQYMLKGQL